jgi:RHS repeat-associated protein
MKRKLGTPASAPDKNAFRRLTDQPFIDPATAKANRETRKKPNNIYKPASEVFVPVEGVPSIIELARALKNDVDLIFQFVHDNIEFYPTYGLHKGGWGTLVDGYGNPFDQADLMVQLLVQAGYTASYVLGNITLNSEQWSNLLNISSDNLIYAAQLLANGGFATFYDTYYQTIEIDYCWVQCEIDGTNYQFDPATKTYNYVGGIDLASVMGYSQTDFLSAAQTGATITANYAQNINEPNISANLSTYAMNLVDWIASNNSGANLNQILGGQTIVPIVGQVRQTELPYQSGSATTYSSLPESYIATLQITYGSIDQTFYTNDIYGYRMSLFFNSSHEAQLYLNMPGTSGNIVATSGAQTIGTDYPITFTVVHPYASDFADGPDTLTVTAGAYYAIGTAWGYAGRQMAEIHRLALVQAMNAGDATDAENVLGESLSIPWWNFSGENTSGTEMINGFSNCCNIFHQNIGMIGFFSDAVFEDANYLLMNFFFNLWSTSALTTTANASASSAHVSLLWHLLEAAVITQTPGVGCASTPSVINAANGGSATATITGTVHVADVLNIFVHDSRLASNPTQVSYTTVSGNTTTSIATGLAAAINGSPALAAIGVSATSATDVVTIQSFSYNNTSFTESVTTGSETITLVSFPGTIIYGANKENWIAVVKPALTAAGYPTATLESIASAVADGTSATISGTVAAGDVLNIFVYDPGLAINPTEISYTTVSADTTTSIATQLAAAINGSSSLAAIGVTASSSANVLYLLSLSVNTTAYSQSVTHGSETITLPNFSFATINGTVSIGGGDVLNIFVHDPALAVNPTEVSYTTISGDTLNTITTNLATLINESTTLSAIGVTAGSSANFLTIESLSSNVTTYTESVTTGSETITLSYNNGDSVTVPDQSKVQVGNYFNGYGYYDLISGGSEFFGPLEYLKGSGSGDISDTGCNDGSSANSPAVNGTGTPFFALEISNEPIDLFMGRYLYSNTDITIGNQGDPYSISLVRSYNSGNYVNDNGLGYGWNHNHQIAVRVSSDGFIGFGNQSVSAAAAAIAEIYVCQDLLEATSPTVPVANVVIICVAEQWLINQIANNTAIVQFGSEYQVFAKLPNGSYVAPLGIKTSTELLYNTTFTYTTPDKIIYTFNSSGQIATITYPFGVTVTYTYTSGLLTKVGNGFRSLTLAYSGSNLASVTDGEGRTISYTIDANKDLTVFEDALTFTTKYSYGTPGLLSQIFRPANPTEAVVTNAFDTLNRVKQQTDAYGNIWNYYFAGSRSAEDDPNGNSRVWYFDGFGSSVQYTDQLGNTTVSQFDGLERPVLVTLPEGNSTSLSYDQFCNLLSTVFQPKPGSSLANISNSFTYDPAWNKVKTVTDGNSNVTTLTYSPTTGQLTQISYPTVTAGTPVAYLTYNSIGQLLTYTDPTSIVTTFGYDPTTHNLLTQVVDSITGHLQLTTTFTYDTVGNIATIEDPNGNITTLLFDANRRLKQQTDPTPFSYLTSLSYDSNNNLTEVQRQTPTSIAQTYIAAYTIDSLVSSITEPVINTNGQQPNPTVYAFDNLRRLQSVVDALGNTYQYTYDQRSMISQITDPNGVISDTRTYTNNGYLKTIEDALSHTTQYLLDGFDRLSVATYADSTTESYTFDSNSNVLQFTTRGTGTIAYTFDALNQTLTKSPSDQAEVSYLYDLSGRLTAASVPLVSGDPSTGSFQQFYDTAGRFFQEEYPDGLTVTFQLDSNGNVLKITYPDGTVISRAYDQLNRLTTISDSAANVGFIYDTLSRRTQQTTGNGIECALAYDQGDNLLALTFSAAASLQMSYVYNPVHQEVGRFASNSSFMWEPLANLTVTYGTVNSVNQYPTVSGSSCSYNGNGCLTGDGTFTYGYDTENHLLSVTGTGISVNFKYDPLERQVEKTVGSTSTRFVYAGLQRIADYNLSSSVLNRYVFGTGVDEPLWVENVGTDTITYLHADETGSIIMTSNSVGTIVNTFSYSPWGQSSSVGVIDLGFAGQRLDPESGLYYFNARYYSPELGRFLQNDPLGYDGGSLNLYEYVGNDPLNIFDPLGLSSDGGSNDNNYGLSATDQILVGLPTPSPWLVNGIAGFGDYASFGASNLIRGLMGTNQYVDQKSGAYHSGEVVAFGTSLVTLGASVGLNALAQGVSQAGGRAVARRAAVSFLDRWLPRAAGIERHHAIPLFGHPVSLRVFGQSIQRARFSGTFFPSGGLPPWLNSGPLNILRLTPRLHTIAHQSFYISERVLMGWAMGAAARVSTLASKR